MLALRVRPAHRFELAAMNVAHIRRSPLYHIRSALVELILLVVLRVVEASLSSSEEHWVHVLLLVQLGVVDLLEAHFVPDHVIRLVRVLSIN